MTQVVNARETVRRKRRMVRKQLYLLPHQEARLKALAHEQLVTEADLIRQAVEAFLDQPAAASAAPLPPDEAAWQTILDSFVEVRQRTLPGESRRWTRADYYDES